MEPDKVKKEVGEGVEPAGDGAGLVSAVGASDLTPIEAPATPNGSTTDGIAKLTIDHLATIEDEEVLDKMLDETTDFEERKKIRAAMRELRKKKRDALLRPSPEEKDQREQEQAFHHQQQEEQKSQQEGAVGAAQKAENLSESCVHKVPLQPQASPSGPHSRTVGSIFNREDCNPLRNRGGSGGLAEIRKEQAKLKSGAPQGRLGIIARLEKQTGGPVLTQVAKIPRSPGSTASNSKNIKQMLLDWCRAKTYSYENVDIQNFSSSWSDGLAFCALVHRFFPEAFDYSSLNPTDRRHNFQLAFSTAEKLVDCPPLLDVEDMVRMDEPDWKCVYTYIQELYKGLVQKGLVKTKKAR